MVYVKNFEEADHAKVNREAFLGMLDYCRKRNLKVVLLRTPTTKAFWSNRPPEWDSALEELYREGLAVYGDQLPLWDEERTYPYEDNQFEDPNHLMTYYMHNILTPRINQRLLELFE